MASFNRVILMGNLTRDPEVKTIPNGSSVGQIGLAVNRTWFDKASNQRKEEVTFVDVTLWGRDAEVAGQYLAKGRPVLIEGRLTLDSWEDKKTGEKKSKVVVVADLIHVPIWEKRERQEQGSLVSQPRSSRPAAPADQITDEEIPF